VYKLPVLRTVKNAYAFTFVQWRWVLMYATLLIFLLVLLSIGHAFYVSRKYVASGFESALAAIAVIACLALAIGFAVAMHRHYLLGPDPRGIKTTLSW
jgi:hypothetical protein